MTEGAMLGSRRIYTTEEHSEVAIPPEQFLEGNSLILYPEVAQKGVLAVHAKKDKLVLRATSWIGLIPINDHVVVEVRPRVSIHNLESILLRIDEVKLAAFAQFRDYASGDTETPSLLDLLALRLANLVDSIRLTGLHFEYRRVVRRGHVVGAISPLGTAMLRAKTGGVEAISTTWDRTVDTAPNRLIKSALVKLYSIYSDMRSRPDAKRIRVKVAAATATLARVSTDPRRTFDRHPITRIDSDKSMRREHYEEALRLSRLIVDSKGILFRSRFGMLHLPVVLLNMEDAFERYLRSVLASAAAKYGTVVLDGNKGEPQGARRPLYTNSTVPEADKINATPDILVQRHGATDFLIDVKYKLLKELPDREDVNQAVTYSNAYGLDDVFLAYPRRSAQEPNLQIIGKVGHTRLGVLRFDLAAPKLEEEAERFAHAVLGFEAESAATE